MHGLARREPAGLRAQNLVDPPDDLDLVVLGRRARPAVAADLGVGDAQPARRLALIAREIGWPLVEDLAGNENGVRHPRVGAGPAPQQDALAADAGTDQAADSVHRPPPVRLYFSSRAKPVD